MSQPPPPSSYEPDHTEQPGMNAEPDLTSEQSADQSALPSDVPSTDQHEQQPAYQFAADEPSQVTPTAQQPVHDDPASHLDTAQSDDRAPYDEVAPVNETTQSESNALASHTVAATASAALLLEAGSEQISNQPLAPVNAVTHYPATPPPSKLKSRRRRRRDPSPRILVIAFCVWLLGAWFIALESTSMIRPIQWMVLCAFFCVMAFWPVLRLSQFRDLNDQDQSSSADSFRTPGRLFIDWLCLNLIFQTIIWPLHLNAQWHISQTWWISATLASWSLITGAITALGCRSDKPIHRTLAAAICMLLLVGEPVLLVLARMAFGITTAGSASGHLTYQTTPLALVWELTSPAATWAHQPWQTQVPAAALAGITGWLVIIATRRWAGQSSEPAPQPKPLDATVR